MASLLLAFSVGGCGANTVIQQHNVEDTQSATDMQARTGAAIAQCAEVMRAPEIIRAKVNFSPEGPSAGLLVLNEKPTPKEAETLLAWSTLRGKCADIFRAATSILVPQQQADAALAVVQAAASAGCASAKSSTVRAMC